MWRMNNRRNEGERRSIRDVQTRRVSRCNFFLTLRWRPSTAYTQWESSSVLGDEWIHKMSPSRADRIYNYTYEMTRLFRVISWGRTASKEGGSHVYQPSSSRHGGGKKNIGNKGKACRSVGCIGRTVLLQWRTTICNHVDFYGISYYCEIYKKARRKRRLHKTVSWLFERDWFTKNICIGGCDFYCTFYCAVKLFFSSPRNKRRRRSIASWND